MANRHGYHERYMGNQGTCNQLIQEQTKQKETLVHVISILNVTRYAIQVNRQKLIKMMDVLQRSYEDLNRLFSIRGSDTMH